MKYISYKDYLNNYEISDEKIFIGKTSKSILIGPKIDNTFEPNSFFKRIISNSIYDPTIYKKISKKVALENINTYYEQLKSNEVIEVKKDGNIIIHQIINLPKGN